MKFIILIGTLFFNLSLLRSQIIGVNQIVKLYENKDLEFRDNFLSELGFEAKFWSDSAFVRVLGNTWTNKVKKQMVNIKQGNLNTTWVVCRMAVKSNYDLLLADAKKLGYKSFKSYSDSSGELHFIYQKGEYFLSFMKYQSDGENRYSVKLSKTLTDE